MHTHTNVERTQDSLKYISHAALSHVANQAAGNAMKRNTNLINVSSLQNTRPQHPAVGSNGAVAPSYKPSGPFRDAT